MSNQPQHTPQEELLRLPKVLELVGFGKSTLWNKIKDGTFPTQYKIGTRISVWKLSEVNAWIEEQTQTVGA